MLDIYLESLQNNNMVFVTEGKFLDVIKNLNYKKLGEVFKNLNSSYVKPISSLKTKFKLIPKMSPSTANNLIEGKVKNYKVYKKESKNLVEKSDLNPQIKEGLSVLGGITGALQPNTFKKMKLKIEDNEKEISGWDLIASFMQGFGTIFFAIVTAKGLMAGSIGTIGIIIGPPTLVAVGCLVCAYIIQMVRE